LLPLVARAQIGGGPEAYGALLSAIGIGAVSGAFALPGMKARLGPNRAVALGTLGTAAALVLFGVATNLLVGAIAGLIAGVSWIVGLASLNVSAQLSLPDWVRGRGLAVYVTVMFASLTAGSAIWGRVAALFGPDLALQIAAAGAVLGIGLTLALRLPEGAAVDLTPSGHWPNPAAPEDLLRDDPPVMVEIEYRLTAAADRTAFVRELERLSLERRRDGAYSWGLYQDTAEPALYREIFLIVSWSEHLRQHDRVTNADRAVQDCLDAFLDSAPVVRHNVRPRG
jgi:MFS family permease